jgi:hypothetical protein
MEKAEALGFNLGFPPLTATQTPVLPEAGYWDGTMVYQPIVRYGQKAIHFSRDISII